jgi:hypothetical protein
VDDPPAEDSKELNTELEQTADEGKILSQEYFKICV